MALNRVLRRTTALGLGAVILTLALSGCAAQRERISYEDAAASSVQVIELGGGIQFGERGWAYVDPTSKAEVPLAKVECEDFTKGRCYATEDGSVEFRYFGKARVGTLGSSLTLAGEDPVSMDCAHESFWNSAKICAPFTSSEEN